MEMQSPMLPLLALLMFLLGTQAVVAGTLEKLLMPGPLSEAHAKYEDSCDSCHATSGQAPEQERCLDCHKETRADIEQRKGFHGRALPEGGGECRQCHSEHQGRAADIVGLVPSLFDHDKTDFALHGGHRAAACRSCHAQDKTFREASSACIDCHREQDVHQKAMGDTCQDCHSEKSWKQGKFDHDKTDFPLRHQHKDVECGQCHPARRYDDAPVQCVGCHRIQDVHGGVFGSKCDSCHSERAWDRVHFDHARETDFPLRGRHQKVQCHACHTAERRGKALPTDCQSCHRTSDIHQGRFGGKCGECHTTKGWSHKQFDHEKDGGLALTGKHKDLPCNVCHAKGQAGSAEKTPARSQRLCVDCHRVDDLHHGRQGDACGNCHGTESWHRKTRFDHDLSRFPLIGMHAVAPCAECHLDRVYTNTPVDCISCHGTDDEHQGALGEDCGSCHNPNSWTRWSFDHDRQTEYPLLGKHKQISCRSCHVKPAKQHQDVQSPSRCVACHLADDVHGGSFGSSCEQCHQPSSFLDLDIRR
jgi:hypothetical protein